MTRQARTLVLLGVVALVGITALALVARQYAGLSPRSSAASPATSPAAGETPAATSAPTDTAAQARGASSAAAAADPATRLVDGFIEVRRVVKHVMDDHPHAFRSFHSELTGTHEGKVKSYNDVLFELRAGKDKALQAAGITKQEYLRVRQAWRARTSGDVASDGEIARAMDAREAELAQVSLGDYELLDFDF